jgi:hypothetical protein
VECSSIVEAPALDATSADAKRGIPVVTPSSQPSVWQCAQQIKNQNDYEDGSNADAKPSSRSPSSIPERESAPSEKKDEDDKQKQHGETLLSSRMGRFER